MIGIDVKGERTNKELAAKLIQSGLLVLTAGPGLRLLPPGHHPGGDGQGPGHPESSAFLTSARRAGRSLVILTLNIGGFIMQKDLLKLLDLSKEDIIKILNTADQLKYSQKHGIHDYLRGKTLAMIFEKNSTRTRVSFETGMYQLGGHAPVPVRQGEPDRPGRAHRGHRPGAGPLLRRHHDPHLPSGGGGDPWPVTPTSPSSTA